MGKFAKTMSRGIIRQGGFAEEWAGGANSDQEGNRQVDKPAMKCGLQKHSTLHRELNHREKNRSQHWTTLPHQKVESGDKRKEDQGSYTASSDRWKTATGVPATCRSETTPIPTPVSQSHTHTHTHTRAYQICQTNQWLFLKSPYSDLGILHTLYRALNANSIKHHEK